MKIGRADPEIFYIREIIKKEDKERKKFTQATYIARLNNQRESSRDCMVAENFFDGLTDDDVLTMEPAQCRSLILGYGYGSSATLCDSTVQLETLYIMAGAVE